MQQYRPSGRNNARQDFRRLALDVDRSTFNMPLKKATRAPIENYNHVILLDSSVEDKSCIPKGSRLTRLLLGTFPNEDHYYEPTGMLSVLKALGKVPEYTSASIYTSPDSPPILIHDQDARYSRQTRLGAVTIAGTVEAVQKDFGEEALVYLPEDACAALIDTIRTSTHSIAQA